MAKIETVKMTRDDGAEMVCNAADAPLFEQAGWRVVGPDDGVVSEPAATTTSDETETMEVEIDGLDFGQDSEEI